MGHRQGSEPQYPFEWVGVYELPAGSYWLEFETTRHTFANVVFLRIDDYDEGALRDAEADCAYILSTTTRHLKSGSQTPITAGVSPWSLALDSLGTKSFRLRVPRSARYAVFLNRRVSELEMVLRNARGEPARLIREREYPPSASQ